MYPVEKLARFHQAHNLYYETALSEIRLGKKETHWMWFIFPQIKGLGKTYISQYYAVESVEEAKAFLLDLQLGKNIREISNELTKINYSDPVAVMGTPDDLKLRSSMTLFYEVSKEKVFLDVIDKFFFGREDEKTLRILDLLKKDIY